ncbi:MAG: thiamine biosynthesis protein ThiF [Nitrospirales bacterium]|nr:thiamine biosynthesis protein ThiF [Nitrospirales bacterium]
MESERFTKEAFSRNIGLLNETEQERLLNARAAVAGAGGVGGLHILTLARLGIGKFTIADPDTFETVNISRQYGATIRTIGRNKAEVLAEMIKDINPYADVRVFAGGVNEGNLDSFLEGADIFIDGIDFFEIDIRRAIFRKSRAKGIYAVTAAPLGFGATLQVFSPQGMTFDDYFGITDTMTYAEKIASFAVGLAPHPYHIRYMDMSKVNLKQKKGPAVSAACALTSSLVAVETVKILTGKEQTKPVPHYFQIDLLRNKQTYGYLLMGGRNPLQRLKRWLMLKKTGQME